MQNIISQQTESAAVIAALLSQALDLHQARQFSQAKAVYQRILALDPQHFEALHLYGALAAQTKNFPLALNLLHRAMQIDDTTPIVLKNLAIALTEIGQYAEAFAHFEKCIALAPQDADAFFNRGIAYHEQQNYPEAAKNFAAALRLEPNLIPAHGLALLTALQICDWENLEHDTAELLAKIAMGGNIDLPFVLLPLTDNAALIKLATQSMVSKHYAKPPALPPVASYPQHERIRLGYFSADFQEHPVAVLTAQLFEQHDRSRFEVYAFSWGHIENNPMSQRLQAGFDHFLDVSALSELEIAELCRQQQIDIAVDLGGYTHRSRTEAFFNSAAPVQVSFLGYAATLGGDFMDYLIADATVIPPTQRAHYTENIAYMPDCFMPHDSGRAVAEKVFSRAELGLPENAVVFCSFNNHFKFNPEMFAVWMQILQAVPDSVLWLSSNPHSQANLLQQAALAGIAADRLVFAPRMDLQAEHLARQRAADLFLDTLPYNAHTSAIDALWCGLPILTQLGESFAGRVAASLLQAVEMPELITHSRSEYRDLAVDLALNPQKLAALKAKLAQKRLSAPLFDSEKFIRNLENLYLTMHQRSLDGLPPAPLSVSNSATEPPQTTDNSAAGLFEAGNALLLQSRFKEAIACYDQALTLNPQFPECLWKRGNAWLNLGQFEAAEHNYAAALQLKADYAEAHNNLGVALHRQRRFDDALRHFHQALALRPGFANAYNNEALVYKELRRFEDELACYRKALEIQPDFAEALSNQGNTLLFLQRNREALESLNLAVALKPLASTYNLQAQALQALGETDAALQSYLTAVELQPDNAAAYFGQGKLLLKLNRHRDALFCFNKASSKQPRNPDFLMHRGLALKNQQRYGEAAACFARITELNPNHHIAHNNRGLAEFHSHHFEAAISSYDEAIRLKPDFFQALFNRGNLFMEQNRPYEALLSYEQAYRLQPDHDYLLGSLGFAKLQTCDWRDWPAIADEITAKTKAGARTAAAFAMLGLSDSAALQHQCAKTWAAHQVSAEALPPLDAYQDHARVRIAYFSADFKTHPVAILSAELFECHDRANFEVYAFAFGGAPKDAMRLRLEQAFEHFYDISSMTDLAAAKLARELQIDIAVDLGGYTTAARTGIFALRAAPVQVSYLGYPGSMGTAYMDYMIANKVLVPADLRPHFSENMAFLPGSYLLNDSSRAIAETVLSRTAMGLPETGLVFCCFNNAFKITPAVFAVWLRILQAVPDSVLWLSVSTAARDNLQNAAVTGGIAAERLVFAERLDDAAEHLARLRLADLFLDTLPYNAHATAVDALWAGLPVLTCAGETFAGRVGASLLTAIELPELITENMQDYEKLAVSLAGNPQYLADLKNKLAANRLTTALFNTPQYARDLENAFLYMHQRCLSGLPAEDFGLSV